MGAEERQLCIYTGRAGGSPLLDVRDSWLLFFVLLSVEAVHRETLRPPGEEDHPGRVSPAALPASQLPLVCLHEPRPGRHNSDVL